MDEIPRTVEFVAGKVTEITWENTPGTGQIQITKLSADDNELTGLPAGTPLAGVDDKEFTKIFILVSDFEFTHGGKKEQKPDEGMAQPDGETVFDYPPDSGFDDGYSSAPDSPY